MEQNCSWIMKWKKNEKWKEEKERKEKRNGKRSEAAASPSTRTTTITGAFLFAENKI